jgi:hypothetical protein
MNKVKRAFLDKYTEQFEKFFGLKLSQYVNPFGVFFIYKFCRAINQTQLRCREFIDKKYGPEAVDLINQMLAENSANTEYIINDSANTDNNTFTDGDEG